MKASMNGENTTIAYDMAWGNVSPDTIINSGFLFNGFTSEFIIELCQRNR